MFVLIPMKTLNNAKQRLSTHLTPLERKHLVSAMLADVLEQLSQCLSVLDIFVVTKDRDVKRICAKYHAQVLSFPDDMCMNSGVYHAVKYLETISRQPILIIPGDLPLIKVSDIEEIAKHRNEDSNTVFLLPSKDKSGTNGILFTLSKSMDFSYGEKSLNRHKAIAMVNDMSVRVLDNDHISQDVDNIYDLDLVRRNTAVGENTRAAIKNITVQWEGV